MASGASESRSGCDVVTAIGHPEVGRSDRDEYVAAEFGGDSIPDDAGGHLSSDGTDHDVPNSGYRVNPYRLSGRLNDVQLRNAQ